MGEFLTHTLANGLRLVHCPIKGGVSYCGLTVDIGTRDEAADEFGLAHLVEHTIFKGTAHRRACHVRNRMEVVGGELNAFTTKEETVLYSIYPSAYQERAMELLGDLVATASFPDEEFEKEKDVVIEEIEMYRDTPSELIYDEFENSLFAGHSLGHNILGTPSDLETLTPAMARNFLAKHYRPEKMVFFSLGCTPFEKIVRWAERYFGAMSRTEFIVGRSAPADIPVFSERRAYDTHQAHVIWGRRTYTLYDDERVAMLLLNNIIGGPGLNSLLNVALRERCGYVYTVESAVTNYTDTGVFSVYFGTESKHVKKCLSRIRAELDRLCRTQLTQARVSAAKKQYLGQLLVSEDNNEGLALAMGKSFLRYGTVLSQEEQALRIESISVEALHRIALEMLDTDSWSLLSFES